MNKQSNLLLLQPEEPEDFKKYQLQAKEAIFKGQAWSLVYLLARVKDSQPYDNFCLPDKVEAFEFSLKGLIRLEMMHHKDYKGWRRLFGAVLDPNKGPKRAGRPKSEKERFAWRSRVALKAFTSSAAALDFIRADPLWTWQAQPPTIPAGRKDDDWHVVFQVQDVWIAKGRYRWSELLARFLLEESRALHLVGLFEPLPPAGGGSHA